MPRPRKPVDYRRVRELALAGCGSRQIARKLRLSRSLIQRILNGRRPEGGPPSRCAGCELQLRIRVPDFVRSSHSPDDRERAHASLEAERGGAADEEFDVARRHLDRLLDTRPDSSVLHLAYEAAGALGDVVRRRESAAERAADARKNWELAAEKDLMGRWDEETRSAKRRREKLSYSERPAFDAGFEAERERALKLLRRRMKELPAGAVTEGVVDRLVTNGVVRANATTTELGS